jgi:hypothetical protein
MRILYRALLCCSVAFSAIGHAATIKPIIDARLRYEYVDQDGTPLDSNALTLRTRFGAEASQGDFALLAEGEGTVALDAGYFSGVNRKTSHPIVADPENIELNRLQLQFRGLAKTLVTVGRQRINIDDQRFVGSAGWRQNEQTFDAARIEWSGINNLKLDLTYSWSDRTIYGEHGGENGFTTRPTSIDGDNVFANISYKSPVGLLTGFYYRVDEDSSVAALQRNSSNSYGVRFAGSRALSKAIKWGYVLSYARQVDSKTNPIDYAANYLLAEGTLDISAFRLGAGVEILGADKTAKVKATGLPFAGGFSFQTPFATLHKFQGWADKFLTTPPQGITDYYGSAGYGWKRVGLFDLVSATAVYHRFDSDVGKIHYGDEVDLQLMAKARRTTFIAKYADYRREGIASFAGDADTKKFWFSIEWAL